MRWLALLAFALASTASAHLMPAGEGTVNVVGSNAYLVMSIPAASFTGADLDGDGLVSAQELALGEQRLRAQFRAGMELAGGTWQEVLFNLPTAGEPGSPPSPEVMVMAVASFAQPPATLTLRSRLWGTDAAPIRITATVSQGSSTLAREVGMLSKARPEFVFFAPPMRALTGFIQLGLHHILSGADHLLFLVTILAAGVAWRRWCWLLTAFTLAHGTTFALASMGWVSLPQQLIEAAIAASIVAVAVNVLTGPRMALRHECALVFALGLVHGLGFAAAIQGGDANHPLLAIVGFNLGVEAGQVLVAMALFAAIAFVRRVPRIGADAVWQRATAMAAVLIGAAWIVERTFPT